MSFKSAWLNDQRITNISPLPVFDLYSSAYYRFGFVTFLSGMSLTLTQSVLLGPVGWLGAFAGGLRDWMLSLLLVVVFLFDAQRLTRDVCFSYSLWTIIYEVPLRLFFWGHG